ncbi:complex I subunit 5 family protein [Parablautia intestinalis]|uniref:complex I subunit 5 family protein n=1 Tax=Parablautia intestinalis TaxID=2320100 RepID=UPI00256EFEA3|nr:complex I subunit 5 family protein [Parablautia intestinalis]
MNLKLMSLLTDLLLCIVVFFPMVSAIIGYLIGRHNKNMRNYFANAVTGLEFVLFLILLLQQILNTRHFSMEIPEVCGLGLHFTLDGFRALYGTIAAFMWFMSTLFSEEYLIHYRNRNRYYLFLLLTLGATEGVFLSADFYTTFIFFEIMSFTSYVWVAHEEKKEALQAAGTYLAVAVIGGLVMLMGIFLLYSLTGTLMFEDLNGLSSNLAYHGNLSPREAKKRLWAAGICMLFGFGAKAGAFPLHIWLPKAHPVAPAPASALLSGILTKAGMFGIVILTGYIFLGESSWGSLILILGVCTMVLGALLALFSIDLKRTLACSSVSQIGFILVGVGMSGLLSGENVLAVRGSLLHMINHSLIKLVLFMAAGVVYMNVHKLNLNEIRGFGRKKPLLHFIFLMGALGIGGMPLWNGYVSKTLIHESIVEFTELVREGAVSGIFNVDAMKGIEWAFLISGGLTAAYMTKLYVAVFIEKNSDEKVQEKYDSLKSSYMNKISGATLTISAVLLPIMGFLPGCVMEPLADLGQDILQPTGEGIKVTWFSAENLKGAAVSIIAGALIYLVIVRLWLMKAKGDGKTKVYVNRWNRYLDLENLIYRPVLLKALPFVFGVICRGLDSLVDGIVVLLRKTIYKDSKLPHELEEGTHITHMLGCFVNDLQRLANATIWRKSPRKVDYEHKYAIIHEEWSEERTIIGRSLSFGLLLFCVGLIITVIYVLFRMKYRL